MNKVKTKTAKTKSIIEMPIVNPYSAGIDVGDKELVVALPEGLAEQRVRTFGTMTCDLEQIVDLLKVCEIDSVAMESTGVYWKPLFSLLLQHNIKVYLVNARHVRNVTGRPPMVSNSTADIRSFREICKHLEYVRLVIPVSVFERAGIEIPKSFARYA